MNGASLCSMLYVVETLKCIYVITTEVRDFIVFREVNTTTLTINAFCICSLAFGVELFDFLLQTGTYKTFLNSGGSRLFSLM